VGRVRRLAALCVWLLALAGCGDSGESAPADNGTPTQTRSASGCRTVEAPPQRPDGGERRPREPLPEGREYSVRVETNCGAFTIQLDAESAPHTVASFVALARSGFYENTIFHRIVPGFVIQGGDPTGTGTGGPGYQTRDAPPADTRYTRAVVAMAKAADEPKGTAGSQFFVVTAADVGLPPDYAVIGEVTDGLEVVELIGRLGDAAEQPTEVVVIEKMTVSTS
jgi:peptidyl-prolyl cis-trans isomerase B (cyclophilin B)